MKNYYNEADQLRLELSERTDKSNNERRIGRRLIRGLQVGTLAVGGVAVAKYGDTTTLDAIFYAGTGLSVIGFEAIIRNDLKEVELPIIQDNQQP